MSGLGSGGINSATQAKVANRIDHQIESVKTLIDRVDRITHTNTNHAHMLGFHAPPKDISPNPPPATPLNLSLDDCIRELQRSVDALDDSMNLFA